MFIENYIRTYTSFILILIVQKILSKSSMVILNMYSYYNVITLLTFNSRAIINE